MPFPTPFWPTSFWYRLAPLGITKCGLCKNSQNLPFFTTVPSFGVFAPVLAKQHLVSLQIVTFWPFGIIMFGCCRWLSIHVHFLDTDISRDTYSREWRHQGRSWSNCDGHLDSSKCKWRRRDYFVVISILTNTTTCMKQKCKWLFALPRK